jgi:arylformamidase
MAVWPGDPPVVVDHLAGETTSSPAFSRLSFSSHVGTHVDPPAHYLPGGRTVDQLPLDLLLGPAWLIYLPDSGPITAVMLQAANIPAGVKRLLVRTRNSDWPDPVQPVFDENFVALSTDAAEWATARGIRLVGIDGPGIGPYGEESTLVHQILLNAGVIPLEGLNLAGVEPGPYDLVCLPMLIEAGDGAPARVLLLRDS